MDYEKKYKEALVNMQELYNSMKHMSSTDALYTTMHLEKAFPELKESEDERIVKEITDLVMQPPYKTEQEFYRRKELVAWLEKQGEQNPAWSEEDERMRNASIRACQYMVEHFENSTRDYEDAIDWLKSLKDRYSWKPSDKQMKGIDCAIKTLRHQLNVEDKRLNSLYEDLKKLIENSYKTN